MKKLITFLTSVFLAGCSVFGIRSADEPTYQVLNDYGHIQIRQYPAMVVAQTEVNADYKNSSSQGFQRLAGYIFGGNKKQQKMAMTAPVIQEQEAETLDMTAPVIQQKSGESLVDGFCTPVGLFSINRAGAFRSCCLDKRDSRQKSCRHSLFRQPV